ncbi:hypothetical protein EOPP23_09355 [Endozoicomonas sp. OPT23]|uniref:hypothetical protein n=1 Tax=Endozoicomonas sp. OPT23 TaxID=2072845 RepID=UPI00129A7AC9|nr:hypothetical protein [Endozoicomonas sp. OPT23]MRI33189.1 hypothetical protein [Endozoicomonas sp. OPT23]
MKCSSGYLLLFAISQVNAQPFTGQPDLTSEAQVYDLIQQFIPTFSLPLQNQLSDEYFLALSGAIKHVVLCTGHPVTGYEVLSREDSPLGPQYLIKAEAALNRIPLALSETKANCSYFQMENGQRVKFSELYSGNVCSPTQNESSVLTVMHGGYSFEQSGELNVLPGSYICYQRGGGGTDTNGGSQSAGNSGGGKWKFLCCWCGSDTTTPDQAGTSTAGASPPPPPHPWQSGQFGGFQEATMKSLYDLLKVINGKGKIADLAARLQQIPMPEVGTSLVPAANVGGEQGWNNLLTALLGNDDNLRQFIHECPSGVRRQINSNGQIVNRGGTFRENRRGQ